MICTRYIVHGMEIGCADEGSDFKTLFSDCVSVGLDNNIGY
jgi:hypothetical protein